MAGSAHSSPRPPALLSVCGLPTKILCPLVQACTASSLWSALGQRSPPPGRLLSATGQSRAPQTRCSSLGQKQVPHPGISRARGRSCRTRPPPGTNGPSRPVGRQRVASAPHPRLSVMLPTNCPAQTEASRGDGMDRCQPKCFDPPRRQLPAAGRAVPPVDAPARRDRPAALPRALPWWLQLPALPRRPLLVAALVVAACSAHPPSHEHVTRLLGTAPHRARGNAPGPPSAAHCVFSSGGGGGGEGQARTGQDKSSWRAAALCSSP